LKAEFQKEGCTTMHLISSSRPVSFTTIVFFYRGRSMCPICHIISNQRQSAIQYLYGCVRMCSVYCLSR